MCVYSMIADHYLDKWKQLPPVRYDPLYPQPYSPVVVPVVVPRPAVPAISQEELDEFRKLLRRARAYDRKNNEPECGLEEKKNQLRQLAQELGVTLKLDDEEVDHANETRVVQGHDQ